MFHNVIAHPLLVIGELFEVSRFKKLARVTYVIHDATVPFDDPRNIVYVLKNQSHEQ